MTDANVTYLNALLGEGQDGTTGVARFIDASAYVSRSGAIVSKAEDYYAAVFRLSFQSDIPLWIPRLALPSVDGISLENTVTIRTTIAAVVTVSQKPLQLLIDAADRILWQTTPTSYYTAVWTQSEFSAMWNAAAAACWADLIVQGAAVVAGQAPFMSPNGATGLMSLTAFPYSLFATPHGADRVEIFMNRPSWNSLNGWPDLYLRRDVGTVVDPQGMDIEIILRGDGLNYLPRPVGAILTLEPLAPATTSLTIVQDAPTIFPSINSVRLLSSLPCQSEFIPSAGSAESSPVLVDFLPDATQTRQNGLVTTYDAAFGNARWVKLVGSSPISMVTFTLATIDWQGIQRTVQLFGAGADASLKVCFAPKRMVESMTIK